MPLARILTVALLVLLACDAGRKKSATRQDDDDDTERPTRSKTSSSAKVAASSSAASSASAADSSAPGGSATRELVLEDGTKLMIPSDAELLPTPAVPDNLVSVRGFRLRADGAFMGVNLVKPTADRGSCDDHLQRELATTKQAAADPAAQELFRLDRLEIITLANGQKALYSRATTRTAREAKKEGPFRGSEGYLLCTSDASVNFSLSAETGPLSVQASEHFKRIVESMVPFARGR